jgi:hypothetical protein
MNHSQNADELRRASRASLLGVMATAVMTVFMWIGAVPTMPAALEPFPLLLTRHVWPSMPPLSIALLTSIGHFGYGAAAAVLFSFLARPMSAGRGFAFGVALWAVMQGMFVPGLLGGMEFSFGLGRGHWLFGGYMLALHLVYGGTLGLLGARDESVHHAHFDELARLRAG